MRQGKPRTGHFASLFDLSVTPGSIGANRPGYTGKCDYPAQKFAAGYNNFALPLVAAGDTILHMCKAIRQLLIVIATAAILFPLAGPAHAAPASQPAGGSAVVISLEGRIDDFSRDRLLRRFEQARGMGATTVILRLHTPGGLVSAGLDISAYLKRQKDLHIIAFIDRYAYSAGAMVALAADEIIMSPGSFLGDAAPIALGPTGALQTLGATERAKAESPILADFYDSAVRNGYDPVLAEAMVTAGREVHWIQSPTDQRKFVNKEQLAPLVADGWTEVTMPGVPQPIDSADTLLTVSANIAQKIALSAGQAGSPQDLAAQRGVNIVADLSPGAGEQVVALFAGGAVRFVLIVVFLISLYVGMHSIGTGIAEAVALTSLGVLVGVPLLTGYAQWWEVAAIVVGLALLAMEIFVIPGFGVAGVLGLLLMVGGLIMTFVGNGPGLPGEWKLPIIWSGVQSGLLAVTGAMLVSLIASLWLRRFLPRMPYFNRLILTATSGGKAPALAPVIVNDPLDAWPFAGTVGRALTDLRPGGSAEFPYGNDRRSAAVVSDSGYVSAGSKLLVREVRGSHVVVRPVS